MSRGEVEAAHRSGTATAARRCGDFFAVSGASGEDVRVEGDLRRVAGPRRRHDRRPPDDRGRRGAARRRRACADGELVVEGDVGDFAGAGMRGGRLVVRRLRRPPARRRLAGRARRHARRRDLRARRRGRGGRRRPAPRARSPSPGASATSPGCARSRARSSLSAGSAPTRAPACGARSIVAMAPATLLPPTPGLHVPPAVPAPVPAPPARARPARDRRADRGQLYALERRRRRPPTRRDPDPGVRARARVAPRRPPSPARRGRPRADRARPDGATR